MTGVPGAIAALLGPDGAGLERLAGLEHELPVALPADAGEVRELLVLAAREGWRVLPLGLGSKLEWAPVPGADLALSTRRLRGGVEYEPGDGTVTAPAGTPVAALEETVRAGGHHLTPELPAPARATLGGALAAGQSGFDRLRYGPLRHHVLGVEVATAGGEVAHCGGRLVKNVTGFELGRLYTGSRGSLAVVLAASLRLFPDPDRVVTVGAVARSADALDAVTSALLLGLWRPLALTWRRAPDGRLALDVVLDGREEAVAAELEVALPLLAPLGSELDVREGEAARARRRELVERELPDGAWPSLRAAFRPSRAAEVLELLGRELDGADTGWSAVVHPGVATADVFLDAGAPGENLCRALRAAGCELEARRFPLPGPAEEPAGAALMARLRAALDPEGVFATDRFRA